MFDKITYNLLKQLYRRGEMTEQEVNNITYLENVCETVPYVAQYWRYTKNLQKKQWKESRRYWITTGIAIAALIKAFLPEIFAGWALLLKLLTQK